MQPEALYRELLAVNERARHKPRSPELVHRLIDLSLAYAKLPATVRARLERK
jgi:hypothetical protein